MTGQVLKRCVEDGKCPNETCAHPFYLLYARHGRRWRKSIQRLYAVDVRSRREAEKTWLPKFVHTINTALDAGEEPFVAATKRAQRAAVVGGLTFGLFVTDTYMPGYYERQLEDPEFRLHHQSAYYEIKGLLDRFGDSPLADLAETEIVRDFKIELKQKGLLPSSYNKVLGKLRQILNWGHHHQSHYVTYVPFGRSAVTLDTKDEKPVERRLYEEPDEEDMLLEAAKLMDGVEYDRVGPLMELRIIGALDTCARRGEMMFVLGSQVDWRNGIIKLPKFAVDHKGREVSASKTGEYREVPTTPRLMELLERRKRLGPKAYLFGKEDGTALAPNSLRKSWQTLKLVAYGYRPTWNSKNYFDERSQERLRDINLRWHDLRHEGASRYGESGKLSLKSLMALLGHHRPETTMRYWELGEQTLKNEVLAAAVGITERRNERLAKAEIERTKRRKGIA